MSENTLIVDGHVILIITKEPSLYKSAPFLMPLFNSAMSIHQKLAGKKCASCYAASFRKAALLLGSAFGELCYNESKKSENQLGALKQALQTILRSSFTEVALSFTINGKRGELRF